MYTHEDIKWIKSVTRDHGAAWAYLDYNVGDIFNLHFPNNEKWYPKNYSKAQPGDLLVLFQSFNGSLAHPKGTYVTHLVTPTDYNVIDDYSPTRPYYRSVMVIGRATPSFIVPHDWSFFKPNRGPVCDINTIERRTGADYTLNQKKLFVWGLFNHLNPELDEIISAIVQIEEDYEDGAEEGAEKEKLKLHKWKERDRNIIKKAKEKALKENRLHCEVCTFDFNKEYPKLGAGFIECHHKIPIATGGVRKTKTDDLAMVCSNCHRMLHRKLDGRYLSIEDLRDHIEKVKLPNHK